MVNTSHIKSTIKHSVIYGSVNVMEKAVGFVMLPFYAHFLGNEGYGILGMIDVFTSVLTVFVGYGIASALRRFYFIRKGEIERKVLVSTATILMFLIIIIISSPALLAVKKIAYISFGANGLHYYITLAIFIFICDITAFSAQGYLLIQQKSIFFSIITFARFLLALLLNIYFLIILKLGVLGVLYSQLVTALLYTIFIHFYVLKSTGFHFNKNDASDILRFSLPLIPGYIAMFFRNNADRIFLRTFLGLSQIGVFAMVYKFALLLDIFFHEPLMKIWPVKRHEIADDDYGPATISKVYTLHLALLLFFGLLLSVEIPLMLKIFTTKEFWVPGIIAYFAVFSRVALSSYYHLMYGLLYARKTYKISIIQAIAALLSVGFNFVLIKNYGILGAFIAALAVNFFMCVFAYRMGRQYYPIPFEWKKITTMILIFVALYFSIDIFSINELYITQWLSSRISSIIVRLINYCGISSLNNTNILLSLYQHMPIIIEGIVKALLSIFFIIFLFLFKIVPKDNILSKVKNLPILNIFAKRYSKKIGKMAFSG